jgi:hypothetical protein
LVDLIGLRREGHDVFDAEGRAVQPRQRGRPRQITRERIVAAARTLAPEALTMQAVSDGLIADLDVYFKDPSAVAAVLA